MNHNFRNTNIENSGNSDEKIKRRIAMTRCIMGKLAKIWRDRNITVATKTRLLRSLEFPMLFNGVETWTVKERERQLIVPWTQRRTKMSILQEFKSQIKTPQSSVLELRVTSTTLHVGMVTLWEDSLSRVE